MVELTDHAERIAESGLFLSSDHRQRFRQLAGMLSAGGGSVLLTGQSAVLAEHYGLMLREVLLGDAGIVVENYLPGSSMALLTRFNAIVASLTVPQARGLETQPAALPPVRIFLVHDPETFDLDEAGLLARLLADFPGARVRLLLLDSGGGEVVPRLQRLFRRQLQVWSIGAPDAQALASSRVAVAEAGDAAAFDALLDRAGLVPIADESPKESLQADDAGQPETLAGQSEAADALGLLSPSLPGSSSESAELWTPEVDHASRRRLPPKTFPKARRPLHWGLGAALLMLALASLPLSRPWMQHFAEGLGQPTRMPVETEASRPLEPAVPAPLLSPINDAERLAVAAAAHSDVFYLPEPNGSGHEASPEIDAGSGRMDADVPNQAAPLERELKLDEVVTVPAPVEADLALRLKQGEEALLAAAETAWFAQNHRFTEATNAMSWILRAEVASLSAVVPHLLSVEPKSGRREWMAIFGPFDDVAMAERFVQEDGAAVDYWIRSRQSLLEVLEQPLEGE